NMTLFTSGEAPKATNTISSNAQKETNNDVQQGLRTSIEHTLPRVDRTAFDGFLSLSNADDQALCAEAGMIIVEKEEPMHAKRPLDQEGSSIGNPTPKRKHQMEDVEDNILQLKAQKLQEYQQPVYIPPQSKANLQARDDDLLPLMERVGLFLESNRELMLILGDSGAGKSTFNRHLEQQLWTLEPRPWITEDYMRMLTTIPNLLDLAKNPFLLTLAFEVLPDVTEGNDNLSSIRIT
ncbi:hypothetical protein BGX29_008481, partial [Mortierella sp. GBA35]